MRRVGAIGWPQCWQRVIVVRRVASGWVAGEEQPGVAGARNQFIYLPDRSAFERLVDGDARFPFADARPRRGEVERVGDWLSGVGQPAQPREDGETLMACRVGFGASGGSGGSATGSGRISPASAHRRRYQTARSMSESATVLR